MVAGRRDCRKGTGLAQRAASERPPRDELGSGVKILLF